MTNYLKLLPVLALLSGCAAASSLPALSGLIPAQTGPQILTTTNVNLSEQNYKIVKADATGSSTGFSFLGLMTLRSPQRSPGSYRSANVAEGKAQALINVMHEHTSNYYLLFALPRITVRADVIEFTGRAERVCSRVSSARVGWVMLKRALIRCAFSVSSVNRITPGRYRLISFSACANGTS